MSHLILQMLNITERMLFKIDLRPKPHVNTEHGV